MVMPFKDGIVLGNSPSKREIEHVGSSSKRIPVIMLTWPCDVVQINKAVSGISDYMLKPAGFE